MLESKITRERYISAEQVAKEIWSTYNNDVLMDEHARFSRLHVNNQTDPEYGVLRSTFGLARTGRGANTFECTARCSDIKSVKVSVDTKTEERNVRR